MEIGVSIATPWRHCHFYVMPIFIPYRHFFKHPSFLLVPYLLVFMPWEFERFLRERFRDITCDSNTRCNVQRHTNKIIQTDEIRISNAHRKCIYSANSTYVIYLLWARNSMKSVCSISNDWSWNLTWWRRNNVLICHSWHVLLITKVELEIR